LNDLLRAYAPPEDSLGAALADLQTKYDIKDSEL
jgi:hypothetical protein